MIKGIVIYFPAHLYNIHKLKIDNSMKVFECEHCDYTTSLKSRYTDHMRVHRKVRDIPCPHCDKLFMTHRSLAGHKGKVHGPKKYRCKICGYMTSVTTRLREHIQTKHGDPDYKPYKCPYCSYRCASGGNCRKHVKSQHVGMPLTYEKVPASKLPGKHGIKQSTTVSPKQEGMTPNSTVDPNKDIVPEKVGMVAAVPVLDPAFQAVSHLRELQAT